MTASGYLNYRGDSRRLTRVRATGINHVSIAAADLEESTRFYEQVFGMERIPTPTFEAQNNETGLMTAGGFVLEFDPKKGSTHQVLPPVGKERGSQEAEEGSASQFDEIYQRLGSSFREAKWLKGKEYVAAVMRREEGGEILIVQYPGPTTGERPIYDGRFNMQERRPLSEEERLYRAKHAGRNCVCAD